MDHMDPATHTRLLKASDTADSIAVIDLNPYVLTEYETRMKAWYIL